MSRPPWLSELDPVTYLLVRDRRLLIALEPTRWEGVLERLALACWDRELVRLGDRLDERRQRLQWERARREVELECST